MDLEHPHVCDFIAHLHLKNLSSRTIGEYSKILRALFAHLGPGVKAPDEVTIAQLRQYVASLQARGLAPKSVSDHVVAIKRFFGFLILEGHIAQDPSLRLPRPKTGRRLPQALSLAQTRALFTAMHGDEPLSRRDRMLFRLIYACGLRVSEATGLRVEDVDFDAGALRVIGKGDRERRLYLKSYLQDDLRAYVADFRRTGYLFPGRGGEKRMTSENVEQRLKRYVARAGLPRHVHPHTLRHSIAVHYLLAGASITFVQSLLGHASLATTGIYTQLVDGVRQRIVQDTPLPIDPDTPKEIAEGRLAYIASEREWDAFVAEVLEWLCV